MSPTNFLFPKISSRFRITHFLFSCFIALLLVSCTADEEIQGLEKEESMELSRSGRTYKGIFATQNSNYRGVFELHLPGGIEDLNKLNRNAVGKIVLHTGVMIEAKASKMIQKSSSADFKVLFESSDLSFIFTLDENDNPLITDVAYKDQASSIIASEHNEDSEVKPITGAYKCTNCQDQNTNVEGIDLNNEERTFNMLLTTKDGSTNITIQAWVGMLLDTNLLVNESCTATDQYNFCVIKSGDYDTKEPLEWSGVHRYTTSEQTNTSCSTLAGVFTYTSSTLVSIKGEFKSDSTCPNTSYFVSATGSDDNTGLSPQDPWKTISKVNSIQLKPGDQVLFEGNNEYPGNIYLDSNDGNNSANPVKISTYGTGKATIKAGASYGIYAYNTAGYIISNLIIAGNGMNSNTNSGVMFYNDLDNNKKLDFIEITKNEIYGFRDFGIVIGSWNGNSGFSNVLIENNKVHDILDVGISSYGYFSASKTGYAHSNITVRNCEVYNIKGYAKDSHSGNPIVLADVQNSVIEHCTAYNSGSGNTYTGGGPVGIWYWDADNVTIQFNEVYGMASGSKKDGGGFDLDGGVTNGIMQYNYSHDNDGAGYLIGQFTGARPMSNITVRYNISQNDAATNGGSVYLFNGTSSSSLKDVYVHNNTFYLNPKGGYKGAAVKYILWKTIKDNINFYNNILYATNGAALIDIPSGYSGNFKGNLYHAPDVFEIKYNGTSYNSLESFRSSGNEVHENLPVGIQGQPLLTNAGQGGIIGFGNQLSSLGEYRLKTDSPAINAGITIPFTMGDRDFFGSNLIQVSSKDIGAHYLNNN